MEEFSIISSDPCRSAGMQTMQRWVEKYLCGVTPLQRVVGNRQDPLGVVSQREFDVKDRRAQVCPFARDALDMSAVWMEESDCDGSDEQKLMQLLLDQIDPFLVRAPAYDPAKEYVPAGVPHLWKVFITFFPRVTSRSGDLPMFERVHAALKPEFVRRGLMIGQFYSGCPLPSLYNPDFRPFVAPYPAFVIRYMVRDDQVFNRGNPSIFDAYKRFFG